jgi:hypothetical protein
VKSVSAVNAESTVGMSTAGAETMTIMKIKAVRVGGEWVENTPYTSRS